MDLSSEFNDLLPICPHGPLFIAGPCSAETEEQLVTTAKGLYAAGIRMMRAGIWKPRTRPGGFEGAGDRGLEWMKTVKQETGMQLAVEVATPVHVEKALAAGVDLCWVGARTTCDPFAVQALADVLRGVDIPVLVKNPICADVNLWLGAFERIHNAGVRRLGAIHRGFFSTTVQQYRNAPMWEVVEQFRHLIPQLPILFDPSHTGGKRCYIRPLVTEAMSRGYDGLIVESHCRPDEAWTDATQQVTPECLGEILHDYF